MRCARPYHLLPLLLLLLPPPAHGAQPVPLPPKEQTRSPWPGTRTREILGASILEQPDGALVVRLGAPASLPGADVICELLAPGGRILLTETAKRGDVVRFETARLENGPYEIRCLTTAVDDRRIVQHLPWYKGNILPAAQSLASPAPPQQSPPLPPEASALRQMLGDLVRDRLRADTQPKQIPPTSFHTLHSAIMEWHEFLNNRQVRPFGFLRLVYKDDVDDSWQFCRVYLPPDYDPARKWPLVVSLHGYFPGNPPYVNWWDVDRRHHGIADTHNVIVLEPHARGNARYVGIGENDVLRSIQMAQQRLAIDPNRILLTGYSMGGSGTWRIGTRHPEIFAAIAPVFGATDYRATISDEDLARLTPYDRLALERRSPLAQAETLLTTPVFLNHGDADLLVSVEQSRYAARLLQRWGYDIRYWEHPGLGHGGLGSEDEMMRWFLKLRKDPAPRKVRVRSPNLMSAAAYWVTILQRENPLEFIDAEAELLAQNAIRLDTRNVLEVALKPPAQLLNPNTPATVVWNGQTRTIQPDHGSLLLRATDYSPNGLFKTPRREGPISDAFARPFAIVLGTIAQTPEMHFAIQRRANAIADAWENLHRTKPRFFSDNTITDHDLARYSLILVGGPAENRATQQLAQKIPLGIQRDKITIGAREFVVGDAAFHMVYPHPLNDAEYVLIIAANSPAAFSYADELPDDVDFAISDGRISDRLADVPGNPIDPLALVASGFFDSKWNLDSRFVLLGDTDLRAKCTIRKVPKYTAAPTQLAQLHLSDLLEARAEGPFLKMKRDANFRGRPLTLAAKTFANGLAAQIAREAPSFADFNLGPAPWKRFHALIGIEIKDKPTPEERERTSVVFIVKGDGKELFRSDPFTCASEPRSLNVDVTGVKVLRLELVGDAPVNAALSCNWCDARVER